jgi:hypothetical protein
VSTSLVKKSADKPPYVRYAFWNPYNLTLIGGAAAAALATGHWWMGMFAAAGEAIWMLFAPDSRLLRKVWFDKVWEGEQAEIRQAQQRVKFRALPEREQQRALALRNLQKRINQMAVDNPSFTVDLLRSDLNKLEDLVGDFLDLATAAARYEEYLNHFNLDALENDIRRYELQVEKYPSGDDRRGVAQKNLAVLMSRKDRWKELRRDLQTVRGQMDLMENTFRLLGDEIVGMQSPAELGERLDTLRDGVESVRQTAQETEKFLQAVEQS